MRFTYKKGKAIGGKTVYVDQDKAIDFRPQNREQEPTHHEPSAALIVDNTLQLEFLVGSGQLMYVWGYLPRESWKLDSGGFELEREVGGRVYVHDVDDSVAAGNAYHSSLSEDSIKYHESGHLVIGNPNDADVLVEIATGTVIGLKSNQLCCVVLRPEIHEGR